jgi:hypothetical protein
MQVQKVKVLKCYSLTQYFNIFMLTKKTLPSFGNHQASDSGEFAYEDRCSVTLDLRSRRTFYVNG